MVGGGLWEIKEMKRLRCKANKQSQVSKQVRRRRSGLKWSGVGGGSGGGVGVCLVMAAGHVRC